MIQGLIDLLKDCGAEVTFDPGRSIAHHCTFCDAPGPHNLLDLGTYFNGMTLTRAACERCTELRSAIINSKPSQT